MPRTRGDRVNKLDTLCYEAFRTGSFQRALKTIRNTYGIPEKGFPDEAEYERWQVALDRDKERSRAFHGALMRITREYLLTPPAHLLVREYIAFGKTPIRFMSETNFEPCDIEWPHQDNGDWSKSGVPFVKIVISGYASQEDVRRYVKGMWKAIQLVFEEQRRGATRKRIKSIADPFLNERVFELSQMSSKELTALLAAVDPTQAKRPRLKMQKIRQVVAQETGRKLSEDRIEQIIKRYKRERGT